MNAPRLFTSPDDCVEAIIGRVGPHLVVGTPLGIGKPNHLLNALFRRAARDPAVHLKISTALSLERPAGHSELERRFLQPFVERVFGDYPELDYMQALRGNRLPPNVEISEFYFKSGSMLSVAAAQQNYTSTNYTHVARDMLAAGINVVAQAVAKEERPDGIRYSLSSNPDVTLDLLPGLREAERQGRRVAVVGMVNRKLPFMYGAADLAPEYFDLLVDEASLDHHLFAIPNTAIDPVAHMIGLHASTLIRDSGTLQVGIGSLGDACVYALQLRHADNSRYRQALDALGIRAKFGASMDAIGAQGVFREGLYAGSEMFGDGLLHLYEANILKRRVYDHTGLQGLLNAGRITENVGQDTLLELRAAGVIQPRLTRDDVAFLQRFGILRPDVVFDRDQLVLPDGTRCIPDIDDRDSLQRMTRDALGTHLTNAVLVHAAFFLGTQRFYDALHAMPKPERKLFAMEAVSTVNELFGNIRLEELQHRHARFLNICMKMTLLGAAVSDSLADGQVVSGVGGQYNFVAMAHALKGARSVLLLKSTHRGHAGFESNIVWDYTQCTIPRHLRDVVVTEYGIADLRGKQDKEVIAALLNIADSRFQTKLLAEAQRAGKLPADHRIPEVFRHNTPQRLQAELTAFRQAGLFPDFPFGHDFTPEELQLAKALQSLQQQQATWGGRMAIAKTLFRSVSAAARPYLERLGLDRPRGIEERLLARLVSAALRENGAF